MPRGPGASAVDGVVALAAQLDGSPIWTSQDRVTVRRDSGARGRFAAVRGRADGRAIVDLPAAPAPRVPQAAASWASDLAVLAGPIREPEGRAAVIGPALGGLAVARVADGAHRARPIGARVANLLGAHAAFGRAQAAGRIAAVLTGAARRVAARELADVATASRRVATSTVRARHSGTRVRAGRWIIRRHAEPLMADRSRAALRAGAAGLARLAGTLVAELAGWASGVVGAGGGRKEAVAGIADAIDATPADAIGVGRALRADGPAITFDAQLARGALEVGRARRNRWCARALDHVPAAVARRIALAGRSGDGTIGADIVRSPWPDAAFGLRAVMGLGALGDLPRTLVIVAPPAQDVAANLAWIDPRHGSAVQFGARVRAPHDLPAARAV